MCQFYLFFIYSGIQTKYKQKQLIHYNNRLLVCTTLEIYFLLFILYFNHSCRLYNQPSHYSQYVLKYNQIRIEHWPKQLPTSWCS
jgi:hypothetical protein